MISNDDIRQIFQNHESKYDRQASGKDWKWSCSCGQDKTLQTREICVMETHSHWAAKIADLLPIEGVLSEGIESAPFDLSILSYLTREVDCERMTMPQARRAVGEWFHGVRRPTNTESLRTRMRRLKQITDAMNEETQTLLSAES